MLKTHAMRRGASAHIPDVRLQVSDVATVAASVRECVRVLISPEGSAGAERSEGERSEPKRSGARLVKKLVAARGLLNKTDSSF